MVCIEVQEDISLGHCDCDLGDGNVLRTARPRWWGGYGLKFTEIDNLLDLRKGFLYLGIIWGL